MANKIMHNLRKKAAEIALDEDGVIAEKLKWMAINAILNGPGSHQWHKYMELFADTPEQLNRLKLEDDKKNDPKVRSSCAYIVSNAICGTQTGTQTHKLVDLEIDEGLPL
jgi:hypothetical protein